MRTLLVLMGLEWDLIHSCSFHHSEVTPLCSEIMSCGPCSLCFIKMWQITKDSVFDKFLLQIWQSFCRKFKDNLKCVFKEKIVRLTQIYDYFTSRELE